MHEGMKMHKEDISKETVKETKKLLGLMKEKNIFLYTLTILWYLRHGLKLTGVHQLVKYD